MDHLYPGDGNEHGAILHAGIYRKGRSLRLLVQHLEIARGGVEYVVGQNGYHALTPTFIRREILQCRDSGSAYLAIHNHGSDRHVAFSRVDMQSHERGYPALLDIGRGIPIGALVYGRHSVAADIWLPDGSRKTLGKYYVVDQSITRLFSRPKPRVRVSEKHERQVRMFGQAGQNVLKKTKVAVVGLGGVGSLMAEYLARLGVGNLILIDPERIEKSNLSRVVGARNSDIAKRRFKVDIALRHVREMASETAVTPLSLDVVHSSAAEHLCDCDFIFLAADSMRARLLVNAITHQYLVPSVQAGTKVLSGLEHHLDDAMCVVRHVRPGQGCLWCNGLINSTQLAIEAKSDRERKEQEYGVGEPNPSVITMNAVAAAHAVNDFLFDVLDLRRTDRSEAYQHYHFHNGKSYRVMPRRSQECSECVGRLAKGESLDLPTIG